MEDANEISFQLNEISLKGVACLSKVNTIQNCAQHLKRHVIYVLFSCIRVVFC